MKISDLELADLKSRTTKAIRTNSVMANTEGYIETLRARIGKSGVDKVKAADTAVKYLYQLILQAELQGPEVTLESITEPVQEIEKTPSIEPLKVVTEERVHESQGPEVTLESITEPVQEIEKTPSIEPLKVVTEERVHESQATKETPIKVKETTEKHKGKKEKDKNKAN